MKLKRILAYILIVFMLLPGTGTSVFALEENGSPEAAAESSEAAVEEAVEDAGDASETGEAEGAQAAEEDKRERTKTPESADPSEPKAPAQNVEKNGNTLVYEGDGYTVTLEYGKDAGIPAGTSLEVREILADSKDKAEKKEYKEYHDQTLDALKEERTKDKNNDSDIAGLGFARFFDITLMSGDKEIEPKGEVSVKIEFDDDSREKVAKANDAEKNLRVVHIEESKKSANKGELEVTALDNKDTDLSIEKKELAEASFTTDSFSVYGIVYTVDFWYGDYAFSMTGESSVLLSSVFENLGIIGEEMTDVLNVAFSDESLVRVEKVTEESHIPEGKEHIEGDWILKSLKPFDTEETLTVEMRDKVIEILVTDAVLPEGTICKIVDTDDSEEHLFTTLNDAVSYARQNGNGQAMSATNAVRIEMLVDYVIPVEDKVTLNQGNDNIIITTAATTGGTYNFTDTQKSKADEDKGTAILTRGFSGTDLFTVSNASAKLTTTDIIFDGDREGTVTGTAMTGRAINVSQANATVTIKDGSTFRNFYISGNGSAIYTAGNLTLLNEEKEGSIRFDNNQTTGYGGSVYVNKVMTVSGGTDSKGEEIGNPGTVWFNNSKSGNDGGAVYCNGFRMNKNSGTLKFTDCATVGNGDYEGGAIQVQDNDFLIEKNKGLVHFENCYTDQTSGDGGAVSVFNSEKLTIECTKNGSAKFINCAAAKTSGSATGGALYTYNDSLNVIKVTAEKEDAILFENCSAGGNGGAICQSNGLSVEVKNARFKDCSSRGNGGGIYAAGATAIIGTDLLNCEAINGGGVYSGKDTTVSGEVSFSECMASKAGGAVYDASFFILSQNAAASASSEDGSGQIDSKLGWKCDADYFVNTTDSIATISGRKYYKQNSIPAIGFIRKTPNGYWQPAFISTDPAAVIYNTSNGGGPWNYSGTFEYGGLTWYYFQGNYGWQNTSIDSDLPRKDFSSGNGNIETEGIAVLQAANVQTGIAEDITPTTLNISNCNAQGGNGGGIYAGGTSDLLGAVNLTNCKAVGSGGGFFANNALKLAGDAEITAKGCRATNGDGGAIYKSASGVFSAKPGAAISMGGTASGEECTASRNGGGLYAGISVYDVIDITAVNCMATSNGGGIYAAGELTLTERSQIKECTAANGGGVFSNAYSLNMDNCSITNCTANNGSGGGVYANKCLTVNGDVSFDNCEASQHGGAVYVKDMFAMSQDDSNSEPSETGGQIDSKLGWACDADYFVDTAGKVARINNSRDYYKQNSVPAIGFIRKSPGGYWQPAFISTDPAAVIYNTHDGGGPWYYSGTFEYGERTWYYFQGNYGYQTTAIDSALPRHDFTGGDGNIETEGIAVLQAAHVQTGIAKDVRPTTLKVTNCHAESGNGGGAYFYAALNQANVKGNVTFEACYATAGNGGGAYFNSTANLTGAEAVTFKGCHADSTSTSNGGGGAWFNNTATLDGAVSFEDCYTGGNGGAMYFANGGTMTGVNVDGHKTLDSATNNAAKGGAIFLANSKTLTIKGGEIKNCSASDTNGGAINVGGSGAKVNFEGNAVVYDNKSTKAGQKVQANMVLDQNNNTVVNTTANGLGTGAHIGVYVTGNNANPYNSHGKESQPFGTAANVNVPGGMQNVDSFTNDRKESLFGVSSGDANDKLIYWSKPICKIIDTNPDGGTQIGTSGNYEHPFNSLNEAVTYARNSFNNGSAMSASNPAKIEMLVDYAIPERDKVTLDQANDNIIITTAKTKTAAQAANETFYFEKSFNAAQGRQATDSDATAILKRGSNFANSLFTLSGANSSLRTQNITFDGANISTAVSGSIIKATKGNLTIAGDTTVRNAKSVDGVSNGGAIQAEVPVLFTTEQDETILFENCSTNKDGGAIETNGNKLTIDNKGTLKATNCSAVYGGFICTDSGGEVEINNSGTIEITGCNATSYNGGAIFTGNFLAKDNSGSISFTGCHANNGGGAVYVNSGTHTPSDFTLTNTETGTASFTNCSAKNGGGAVYVKNGKCTITGTADKPVTFEKCVSIDTNGGAVCHAAGEELSLTHVAFGKAGTADSGCTAKLEGGCVYSKGKTATVSDCKFYYGTAGKAKEGVKSRGGAIYYKGSTSLSIVGCVFDHCSAQTTSTTIGCGNGGAVFVDDSNVALTIDKSSFTDCYAHRFGGAVMYEQNGGESVSISNTTFTECYTEIRGGGAISTDSNKTTIDSCTFKGCYDKSNSGGGAIQLHPDNQPGTNPTCSISNSTFNGCYTANGNGGAILNASANVPVTMTNVDIDGSGPSGANASKGSAVYSKGDLKIINGKIKNCKASNRDGGAVNLESGKKVEFEGDVVVYDNKGTENLSGQQKNVVLDENLNTKIWTTSTGITEQAHIGVFVTGTDKPAASQTQPFKDHGNYRDDFGTYAGSTDNLDRFTNDRVNDSFGNPLHGEVCPDHTANSLIRWTGYYNVAPTGYDRKYMPYLLILFGGAVLAALTITARRRRSNNTDADPDAGSVQ